MTKIEELEQRVIDMERQLDAAVKSLHQSIPLTVINQVPTCDYPTYTQQQLWFFESEITRWRNQNAQQPGFAICSFRPGIPLHPLVFLPISLVVKILEVMSQKVYETQGATQLITDVQNAKREIQFTKHGIQPKTPLIDLPKADKQNETLE